jgi:hypothetical protein
MVMSKRVNCKMALTNFTVENRNGGLRHDQATNGLADIWMFAANDSTYLGFGPTLEISQSRKKNTNDFCMFGDLSGYKTNTFYHKKSEVFSKHNHFRSNKVDVKPELRLV